MRVDVIILVAAAIGAPAMELVRRDAVLAIEVLPADFDYRLEAPGGEISGSDEFDRSLGARLGGRWSFSRPGARGALVAGLDLRLGNATYGDHGTYRTVGAGLSLGYAYSLGRRWTMYAEPVVELGWASLDFAASASAPAFSADGRHSLYGVRAGAIYALSPRWLIDASLGYVSIASDTSADELDFTIDQHGFSASLGLVWRFSAAPARLE